MAEPLAAQAPAIEHQAVACVVAERFPRLEARLVPADAVAAARVLFQSHAAKEWYSVEMKRDGPTFVAILPRPMKSLKAFHYYVEVTDKAVATARTPDYSAAVVGTAAECKGKLVAGALASASVLLHVPAGAAALPAGFASTGVVAAGSASGAAAAGATAGTGGGLSTAAVVGIVAGAGAAAAGAVALASSAGPETTTSYTGPVTGQWTISQTATRVTPPVSDTTCSFTSALTGTADLQLKESDGSVTGSLSISMASNLTGITGPCTPPGAGGPPFGQCQVTGSVGDIRCSAETTNTSSGTPPTLIQQTSTQTTKFSFSGARSGGFVTGTLSLGVSGQGTGTSQGGVNFTQQFSGATTIPVTLR